MPKIRIRYLSDKIEKLRYIDGKSDWIDLRAAETVELKAGESNSMGVVDESYCGDEDEWKMPVYATRDCRIEANDRIAQFRIIEHQPAIEFEECESLGNPSRGGFGSTGRQ